MAVNRERKMVEDEYTSIDFEYNTLDEAIKRLQTYRKDVGGDARFAIRQYEYSDNTYLALMTTRPETDAEMAKRIAGEERWAALREQQEREDFERLAKKYGKV
jgi:hypothetical protein